VMEEVYYGGGDEGKILLLNSILSKEYGGKCLVPRSGGSEIGSENVG
jgi:hypothetical protein